jgi:hypothetical protein
LFVLYIHDSATNDLRKIQKINKKVAVKLGIFLQQLINDQDLLDRLTQNDYGVYQTADFHVHSWISQQRKGRNLWRFKDWDLINQGLQYRVVYAFTPKDKYNQKDTYHVLAVTTRKDLNYDDENNPLIRRIISDYNNL